MQVDIMKKRNLYGQFALNVGIGAYWSVENFWINMYWSREINPELSYISAMVSISAIVGVLSMIIFGALSDSSTSKRGRRNVYIFWGGILGGISMFLFPFTKLVNIYFGLSTAIIYAVVIDILITLFGDWTTPTRLALFTEHSDLHERGKLNAVIGLVGGVGTALIMGMYILDYWDNATFFYVGGSMMIFGSILSTKLFKDPPIPDNPDSFKECLKKITQRDAYKENKGFYSLLFGLVVLFLGINFYSNYITVYAENVLLFSPAEVGVITVVSTIVGFALTVPASILSDKYGRKKPVLISLCLYLITIICFTLLSESSFWIYTILFSFMSAFSAIVDLIVTTWTQDLTPPKMKGSLLAYLHASKVIPMTPGSILGAQIGDKIAPQGVQYSNLMFLFGGIVAFLSIFVFKQVKDTIRIDNSR
ncbi:MAG: MFS transporter [Candidatus Lokiarchaeota archaeon]|nr:MFS transporter [Candidatus Lokiarchaeota archaeon]